MGEAISTPPPAPVLVLGFNRPDLLRGVLEAVRAAQPRDVLIALDGPRPDHPEDAERCAEARAIAESVDWASDLQVLARETNAGCGPAVSSGIDWAFSARERLIILEDDCHPDPSFFPYCDELLERYADDARVMQISGTNWGASAERYNGYSYAFNGFAPIWGWAGWRRAWRLYDFQLDSWPRFKADGLLAGTPIEPGFRSMLKYDWDTVRAGNGTWDHQWQYTVLRHHGLCVSPNRNLTTNVGMRGDGTHAEGYDHLFDFPLEALEFPLEHPPR